MLPHGFKADAKTFSDLFILIALRKEIYSILKKIAMNT
jgi:hypothetical protein